MLEHCNWEGCTKPRAEPFEYCLDHFADAVVEFYIAGMKAGIKLPAFSNDSTGFGEWTMTTGKSKSKVHKRKA